MNFRFAWIAVAAVVSAVAVVVFLRGFEPDNEEPRPQSLVLPRERPVATAVASRPGVTSESEAPDAVRPPHEVAPAPPFGIAEPPEEFQPGTSLDKKGEAP